MEEQTTSDMNGTADLHRIHSASPPTVSEDFSKFFHLDHAITAPQLPPSKPGIILPNVPASSPLTPRRADFLWKRDKGKDEKKMAEKEREKVEKEREKAEKDKEKDKEKAEKQLRKDVEIKVKEVTTTESTDQSSASATSQPSIGDDHKPAETGTKEDQAPASHGGLDRFKRTSKSLKFGSLGRKDKAPAVVEDDNDSPHSADKEKRNRFSIRKKSFGILS